MLPEEIVCHRIGGGEANNLKLKPAEMNLDPPGISVLIGGSPHQAASDFRRVFGRNSSLGKKAATIGTAMIATIRAVGFDVIADPTTNFPNYGRLVHPTKGVASFDDASLNALSQEFHETTGL
jgi:hypothetical protein